GRSSSAAMRGVAAPGGSSITASARRSSIGSCQVGSRREYAAAADAVKRTAGAPAARTRYLARNATTRRTRGDDAAMRHFRMLPACLALAACAGGAGMQPTDAPPRAALVEPAPIEAGQAPPPGPYAPGFDAVHYGIALTLPDTGSYIRGVTTARIALVEPRAGT